MKAPTTVLTRSPVWALGLASVAGFMVALDALVVATAIPAIQRDLGARPTTLAWTINAYALTYAAGMITAAALGDRLGRRRIFVLGLGLFAAASAACALAPSAAALIAARAVQGIGAAVVSPLSLTVLASAFPRERRGAAVGIWGGVSGLAVASGPLVGGALAQAFGWHWVFWVNVPIGLLVAVLARLRLDETHGAAAGLDLPAVGLVSGGAACAVWGLIRVGDVGWGHEETVAAVGLGVLLLAAFVAWESRARAPMLPLRLFRSRAFTAASASGFLMAAALIPAAFLIAQYLQLVLGESPLGAGLGFLPMTATPLLVAPVAGALSDRIGQRPLMVGGLLLQAAGLAWFASLATPGVEYTRLVPPLLVAGVGVSMPFATTATAALGAVAPADLGSASGVTGTLRQFGAAFGIAIVTAVFAVNGHAGTPAAFDHGFRPALTAAAAISALGALTALGVTTRRRSSRVDAAGVAVVPLAER
ncbi:MAG TPA: DHA2 family efflux MFS transporter permease subunit [Candidatus Dormibacteraeota bacterium]|nr:DHA2 family efflux MFS transporter permease subunit [Candidatus Dormibacteraeota bacterium]